jgi:hypothetical protein
VAPRLDSPQAPPEWKRSKSSLFEAQTINVSSDGETSPISVNGDAGHLSMEVVDETVHHRAEVISGAESIPVPEETSSVFIEPDLDRTEEIDPHVENVTKVSVDFHPNVVTQRHSVSPSELVAKRRSSEVSSLFRVLTLQYVPLTMKKSENK